MVSFNFLRTGLYGRSNGNIYARAANGYWWSAIAGSEVYGRSLDTWRDGIDPQNNNSCGYGFAVRCVARER